MSDAQPLPRCGGKRRNDAKHSVFYRNGREAFDNSSAVAHKGTGRCELCHKKPAESGERFCGACQIKMVRYRARMGARFDGYL